MVGRQDLPTPALDPGPAGAEGAGAVAYQPRSGVPLLPRDPAWLSPRPHHAQNAVCLTLQRLWQGWNVHTFGDGHRPSIQISNNHVQLGAEGTHGQGCTGQRAGRGAARSTRQGPHQLLGLCLESSVDADDEGRGSAEDLQELRRQDGHVGEAATGLDSAQQAPRGQGRPGAWGQWGQEGHLYLRGKSRAKSPRQASESLW